MVLQVVNGVIAFNEATKAGDAIAALKASLKATAQVKRNGVWANVNAAELVPGDRVVLSAGAGKWCLTTGAGERPFLFLSFAIPLRNLLTPRTINPLTGSVVRRASGLQDARR
jgi:hypothetical protein